MYSNFPYICIYIISFSYLFSGFCEGWELRFQRLKFDMRGYVLKEMCTLEAELFLLFLMLLWTLEVLKFLFIISSFFKCIYLFIFNRHIFGLCFLWQSILGLVGLAPSKKRKLQILKDVSRIVRPSR